jgi:hypothetical protein
MSKEIKKFMPPPQSLEYEKTFYPFILLSKKRYVGNLYEDDATKKPKQKSMGIVLKRRDNAPIVKKVYGGIIDIIMNQQNLHASVEFLKGQLQDLIDGRCPLVDLIITKTLRSEYKDPSKIAHKVLAERMGERDPGNKPAVNERIPFVYIKTPPGVEVKLQGDRIEHPDYIREHNITPDFRFYITNQLMKPICQIYALCVEQLPEYSYPPGYWVQMDEELKYKTLYENEKKRAERVKALRSKVVEELLFEPYLCQLEPAVMKAAAGKRRTVAAKKTAAAEVAKKTADECAYVMEVAVKSVKRGYYECKCSLVSNLSEERPTVFAEVKTHKTTMVDVFTTSMNHIFAALEDQPDIVQKMRLNGVFIKTEKSFVNKWERAVASYEKMGDEAKANSKNADIGAHLEWQSISRMERLVLCYYQYKCVLSSDNEK